MSKNEHNREQLLLIKQLIRDYLNGNINDLQNKGEDIDNSFVFLENKTLHMIITYLLFKFDGNHGQEDKVVGTHSIDQEEITASLDSVMADNKILFEEIINILKES